jgi:hypothetical protein
MPYLAGSRRMGRFGIVLAIVDGAAPRSNIVYAGRYTWPGPMPVWPGPGGGSVGIKPFPVISPCEYAAPPAGCTWKGNPTAADPCAADLVCTPELPPVAAGNAGTPVPAGFSTNQIFVAPDGSFWQYSTARSQWVNVGTPYNTGAGAGVPPVTPGTTPSAPTTPAAGVAPPVNVSVAAPSSTYQSILDWLQQNTLGSSIGFSSIPNWIVAAAAAALAWKFSQPSSGRSRNPGRLRAYRRRHR